MNLLEKFEQKCIAELTNGKTLPDFKPGDTIIVKVKIVEGTNERIQAFEGVVYAFTRRGLGSSFIVKKLSNGEGVERTFPLYSPKIDSIQVVRRGRVRRAKLYYMRELRGKAARIKEIKPIRPEKKKAEPAVQA